MPSGDDCSFVGFVRFRFPLSLLCRTIDIQFRPLHLNELGAFQALRLRSIAHMPEAIFSTYEEESSRSPGQVRRGLGDAHVPRPESAHGDDTPAAELPTPGGNLVSCTRPL